MMYTVYSSLVSYEYPRSFERVLCAFGDRLTPRRPARASILGVEGLAAVC